ncbi:MAG TPA: CHAD domain-containing protein [Blastocatellia bacterium]|jgi:CHAD domain-containing protein|nr:CHAD domain-containing protein [Blastocatellia bacterium]
MAEGEQVMTIELTEAASRAAPATQPRTLEQIITLQLETLQAHHRAVLETDDPEAIHKMRVTTRRLQASLDLLEHELHAHKLKGRLREWRRMLSLVRNYDVFLTLIDKEAAAHRPSQREQYELVKAILHKRRERRAAKVRRYMQEVNVGRIASKLGLTITQPPSEAGERAGADTPDVVKEPVTEPVAGKRFTLDEGRIAARMAERLEQRLAEFQALAAQSHPSTKAGDLHQLRIAAKRVRYLLEIISELGYGDASRALGWLRTLQDRIGDWHDLEALEEEIIDIVSRRRFMKEHLPESSRMLQAAAHLQNKKESLVSKLFPVQIPRTLPLTAQRMTKALRRHALRAPGRKPRPVD